MDEEFEAEELAKIRNHQEEETGTSFLTKVLSEKGMAWTSLMVEFSLKRLDLDKYKGEEKESQTVVLAMDIVRKLRTMRPDDVAMATEELLNDSDHFVSIGVNKILQEKGVEHGTSTNES